MPSPTLLRYVDIINQILLKILKEAKDIQDILQEDLDIDKITREEFLTELKILQEKSHHIQTIYQEQLATNTTEDKNIDIVNNEIVYLTTSSNNIYALSDLKDISPEYYYLFQKIFDSIIDGTFLGFKSFPMHGKYQKYVFEVRENRTRIVFDRLKNSIFVIIAIFVKKTNNPHDTAYRTNLDNRSDIYFYQREHLLKMIEDETFLKKSEEITQKIRKKLITEARTNRK